MNSNQKQTEKYWFTTLFDSAETIKYHSHALGSLASAFAMTGNQQVADELLDIADSLRLESENIRSAVSDKSSCDLRETQQATKNMFCALLAGVEINKREDKNRNTDHYE